MNIQKLILNALSERALNLGNRTISYPKSGNILVLAGGAGSGKGFASNKVIAFEGKRFDVDDLKQKMIDGHSKIIKDKFFKATGRDITKLNLRDPADTSLLHAFVEKHSYDVKVIQQFIQAQNRNKDDTSNSMLKQNMIFDVTLKSKGKIELISKYAQDGGYDKKNIHIVWILNDMEIARAQNAKRDRVVADNILQNTHIGASETMFDIFDKTIDIQKYIDGDIWVLFNNAKVNDLDLTVKDTTAFDGSAQKSFIVNKYTAVQLKEQGKPVRPVHEIGSEFLAKIAQYAPKDTRANW